MAVLVEKDPRANGALLLPLREMQRLRRFAVKRPIGAVSLLIIAAFVFMAIFANAIAPYDPLVQHNDALMQPPSSRFILGTDYFGRDILSRIIYGSRISLSVGLGSIGLGLSLGVIIGMVSAYFGGRTDMFIQRIMDAILAFPGLIFALAIIVALGAGLFNVIIAIGFTTIPRNNRIVRGSVLSAKNDLYVLAAQSVGCSDNRIMWRHILPNVAAPIIIVAATELGGAILLEASLSFLGLGIPPPNPSWGNMLSAQYRTYMLVAPWMALFPGIAISLAVLGWNLLGDALRDAWDPRFRGT